MNILFFLLPKNDVHYIKETSTLRQALEKMEDSGYTALPIISEDGRYINTITDRDLLFFIKNATNLDLFKAEKLPLKDVTIQRKNVAIKINEKMENLLDIAMEQNFVPVIDDMDHFIGIVTRRSIINYYKEHKNDKDLA